MLIHVKKRKVGSYKDLGVETYHLENIKTLDDLLCQLVAVTQMSSSESIGKFTFEKYNENTIGYTKAIDIMRQDFKDGLFRVFFNEKEYLSLEDILDFKEENECVLIRLVMMAGRLW